MLQDSLQFKFDICLTLADQIQSEDKDFFVKNMELLVEAGGRSPRDIIYVDTEMSSFTNKLTNGILVPTYRLNDD